MLASTGRSSLSFSGAGGLPVILAAGLLIVIGPGRLSGQAPDSPSTAGSTKAEPDKKAEAEGKAKADAQKKMNRTAQRCVEKAWESLMTPTVLTAGTGETASRPVENRLKTLPAPPRICWQSPKEWKNGTTCANTKKDDSLNDFGLGYCGTGDKLIAVLPGVDTPELTKADGLVLQYRTDAHSDKPRQAVLRVEWGSPTDAKTQTTFIPVTARDTITGEPSEPNGKDVGCGIAALPYTDSEKKPRPAFFDDVVTIVNAITDDNANRLANRRLQALQCARQMTVAARAKLAEDSSATADDKKNGIASYRDLIVHFDQEINARNPFALHLDLYAGTQFSNLYREKPDDGYFAKSRSFLFLEIGQVLTSDLQLATYGLVSLQTKTNPGEDAKKDVQATGGFGVEAGLVYWPKCVSPGNIRLGLIGGMGALAFEDPNTDPAKTDPNSTTDHFHVTTRLGAIVLQSQGLWAGTFSEFAYVKDPRFAHRSRFVAKGRIVLSPDIAGNGGKGLGAYVEGAINQGRGKDEGRITVGVRLDILSVLRGIVGVPNAGTPTTAPAPTPTATGK